jgi:hypothetical protein
MRCPGEGSFDPKGTNKSPREIDGRKGVESSMSKIFLGIITAALWFVLSQAANAERVCDQVCDGGNCVSKCVDRPDTSVIVRDHDQYRDERGPGVDVHAPGVNIDVGH